MLLTRTGSRIIVDEAAFQALDAVVDLCSDDRTDIDGLALQIALMQLAGQSAAHIMSVCNNDILVHIP